MLKKEAGSFCGLLLRAYSAARNVTAHAYDAKTAEMVYAQARPLLGDAGYLLERLEKSAND